MKIKEWFPNLLDLFFKKKASDTKQISTEYLQTIRTITDIIIHCSASPDDLDIGAREIKQWHTSPAPRGNGWSRIGYHFVIRRNGILEHPLPIEIPGIHCKGENSKSIGVCLVGTKKFTLEQRKTLRLICKNLKDCYSNAKIRPHNFYPSAKKQGKTCPNFDVEEFLK